MAIPGWQSETVTAQSTGAMGKYDAFKAANFGAFTSNTNVPENGITYNSATGGFTLLEDGVYEISWAVYLGLPAVGTVTLSLEVDTDEVWTASPLISSAADPTDRGIPSLVVPANAGDELHAFVNSGADVTVEPGTTMTVKKIGEIG